jgi:hypothetical protein
MRNLRGGFEYNAARFHLSQQADIDASRQRQ